MLKRSFKFIIAVLGFATYPLFSDSCFQRLRDKYAADDIFIRQSLGGAKYYVNIDGADYRATMGDATFVEKVGDDHRLEIPASDFENVRIHSPLGEHLAALKRKVPAELWTDSFELGLVLPYLSWAKHPILQKAPKFIRDETVAWIERSQPEYKEKVKAIANDGSLSPAKRVEKLKKLSSDWIVGVGLRDYLDFTHKAAELRRDLYEKYSEGGLPEWLDPKFDLFWAVDFMHPLTKEGDVLEHKWLLESIRKAPQLQKAEIVSYFREHPERAMDFSHIMSELGSEVGEVVIESGHALDFFVRTNRLGHYEKKVLFELMHQLGPVATTQTDAVVKFVNEAPYSTVFYLLRSAGAKKITVNDVEDFILSPYFEQHGYPEINSVQEIPTFVKALRGDVNSDVLAWARIRAAGQSESSPGLQRLIDRLAAHDSATVDVQVDAEHAASILWYPRYPGGHYSWTHTKIVVDGTVYGTMGVIEKFKPVKVHDRKARASLKDAYFRFDIQVSQKELENLLHLVNTEQRIAVDDHWGCVHGTCGTFAAATSLQVPAPFNQLPSATALYLAARNAFGDQKVKNIEFVGRSKIQSLMSPDLARDLFEVVSQPAVATAGIIMVIIGGTVYVVHDLKTKQEEQDEEERKLREEVEKRRAQQQDLNSPPEPAFER
ncbi:MAG: hypothetical protein R3A80_09440 [Bdellovibrionota bacterium]